MDPKFIVCEECKTINECLPSDIIISPSFPDDDCDYDLRCKNCGVQIGTPDELQSLIDKLPDYDPDPDLEYDTQEELKRL